MNKTISTFLLVFFVLGCTKSSQSKLPLQKFLNEYHAHMEEQYHLTLVDQGRLEGKKVKKLSIGFYHYEEAVIRTARHLIHLSTEHLLKKINERGELAVHFDHFPLTEKDLDIAIFFIDPATHERHKYSEISHVALFEGTIYYSAYEKQREECLPIHQEVYISALR